MKETAHKNSGHIQLIHSAIGVAIMIFFRFLPIHLPEITPVGMQIIGIFIGTLYLWTTVDPLWGSLLSIAMIGFSDYTTMPELLAQCFGNATLQQIFFLMVMSGALVYYKITLYIGRFFLSRKFSSGRPWVMALVICLGCFFLSAFINPFTAIFLFWPILYGMFDDIGYHKGEDFPRVLLTLVIVASLIGFPVAPFANSGLALLSNFTFITGEMMGTAIHVNNAAYMLVAAITGIVMIIGCVVFSKLVIKPDTSRLRDFDIARLNKDPLPPMSGKQKAISAMFVILVLSMLLPSLFPELPGMRILGANSNGLALLATAVLGAMIIDDERVVDVAQVLKTNFNWSSYFIIAAAILLGSVLTNETTGVSSFLRVMLSPIFQGMAPFSFTVFLLMVAMVLTNLCNSLVIGMILQPVVITYCMETGTNPTPIVTLMIIFVLLTAAVTPAASPFAAILHSNKEWVPTKYIYKYTIPYLLIELLTILIVGIPLSNLMM
ncbi:MAG: SLC13 family permease [Blautia sp.]|jgi:sodium-dependent dicarboxylate transporter 2/3/5